MEAVAAQLLFFGGTPFPFPAASSPNGETLSSAQDDHTNTRASIKNTLPRGLNTQRFFIDIFCFYCGVKVLSTHVIKNDFNKFIIQVNFVR
jgi:hypothetical protein